MIIEQYVSFETAKLLKEKSFYKDVYITDWWYNGETKEMNKRGNYSYSGAPVYRKEYDYNAPSQSLVMRWLREVHNLVIEPYRTACGYLYTISNIPNGSTLYDNGDAYNGDDEDSRQWTTWENACEDGIKYCLNHLI